jgi:hypothetical protein
MLVLLLLAAVAVAWTGGAAVFISPCAALR